MESQVALKRLADPLLMLGLRASQQIFVESQTDPDTVIEKSFQILPISTNVAVTAHCITYTRVCRVRVFAKIGVDRETEALRKLLDLEDSITDVLLGLAEVKDVTPSYESASAGRLLVLNVDVTLDYTRAR